MEPPAALSEPATTDAPAPATPLGELGQLVRSVRAYLEELEASGAWGAPAQPQREHAYPPAGVAAGPDPGLPQRPLPPAERRAAAPPASAQAHSHPASAAPVSALDREPSRAEPPPAPSAPPPAPAPNAPAGAVATRAVHLPLASTARLTALAGEVAACTRCALHEGRKRTVFSRGTGSSGVVFIGEGPGEEEDRQGLPFVGPAGQLLDRMILAMQLARDEVYVCNIVKCRPPRNRKPEPDEMASCMPFLDEQLSLIEPRVIVALGATAVQGLLGTTEGIMRMRGQWKTYRGKIPLMPTFHPAYLLRTPQAKREVWRDLQEVLRRLREGPA